MWTSWNQWSWFPQGNFCPIFYLFKRSLSFSRRVIYVVLFGLRGIAQWIKHYPATKVAGSKPRHTQSAPILSGTPITCTLCLTMPVIMCSSMNTCYRRSRKREIAVKSLQPHLWGETLIKEQCTGERGKNVGLVDCQADQAYCWFSQAISLAFSFIDLNALSHSAQILWLSWLQWR